MTAVLLDHHVIRRKYIYILYKANIFLKDVSNEPRRYGLGSEERRPTSNYGTNSGRQEEYKVPNHMVGLLIGKGGENLKKIERMSGVSKVQFAAG